MAKMVPRGNSTLRSQNYFQRLAMALEFAVSEWLLIFLLFIDACFSYLITKFASYCKLQSQCLLCSRLDHVLAEDKTGVYWDTLCSNHKSEISSVVLCHVHNKLVDIHGMCEKCLFSFVTKNKSNTEIYRLLVGKMGSDSQVNPLLEDHSIGSPGTGICRCCNEQYMLKGNAKNLLHITSVGYDAAELEKSLLTNFDHRQSDIKKNEDEHFESFRSSSHTGKNHIAPLLEVDYQKVNVTSDTESEVQVSDDDSTSALIPDTHTKPVVLGEDIDHHHGPKGTAAGTTDDLEEFEWQQAEVKADVSTTTELMSFDVVQPSNIAEPPVEAAVETRELKNPVIESEAISKADSEPSTITNGYQMSNYLDLGDAYKLAISSKGRQLSGKLLDQKSFEDSSKRISEDLKLLLSHRSSFQGIELLLTDNMISPRLSMNSDEFKASDSSISMGMQFLQRRISLERNESNISLDGSIVSELEGESVVDRLRRQVEHDKKLMSALYKELEEERNASAIATNQAMAMITRLQEEKAALYTEAMQCLRMMEEQAEYNNEALQNANEHIDEKEKQIQDLEAEIELLSKTSEDVQE